MTRFESGRRLCLLFEAGRSRYAVEATSVMEVATPDEDGHSIRGHMVLQDLSTLLGGGPEERPGVGVVLDVSPTLAIRARRIVEVADVARAPFYMLPQTAGDALPGVVRGALVHQGRLYFELHAEALPHEGTLNVCAPARALYVLDQPPERALVLSSQGRLYGVPLALVSQVVANSESFCALPAPSGPVAGLFPHTQALYPVFSAPGLLGGEALPEPLIVLSELAGQNVGLAAESVLGVFQGLQPAEARGEFLASGMPAPALFLDLQRMFS